MDTQTRQKSMAELRKKIESCTACELHCTATNKVLYRGHESPIILFVGEAPGYYEDKQGKPFVGRAGKVLDTVISRLNVSEYGILNLVKCRPPDNKLEQKYIDVCSHWMDEQIKILNPRLIVALGRWPTSYFFGNGVRITQVSGDTRKVDGRIVFAMLHPASILHSPKYKDKFEDSASKLQLLTMQMGIRKKHTWF